VDPSLKYKPEKLQKLDVLTAF